MIIGISGKIGSGKDTIGNIIQYLIAKNSANYTYPSSEHTFKEYLKYNHNSYSTWTIKKFADKLKEIVCILIGCTRQQLEDHEFKNTPLGEEWTRYAYAVGHKDVYLNGKSSKEMISKFCSKEVYEYEKSVNWQTAYKSELTPRLLLQLIGTECGREIIHPNIWVNALMNEYKNSISIIHKLAGEDNIPDDYEPEQSDFKNEYPNWIITDVRFPNEANAIIEKGGFIIRVDRPKSVKLEGLYLRETEDSKELIIKHNNHPSETALDNFDEFKYRIVNDGTIDDLIKSVEHILKQENLIV